MVVFGFVPSSPTIGDEVETTDQGISSTRESSRPRPFKSMPLEAHP